MRNRMGVMIVVESSGEVGIQLFENPDAGVGSFKELKGRPGEKKRRVTFVKLEYNDDGSVKLVEAEGKDIPLPLTPADEIPDGYVIGEGPRRSA